MAAEVLDRLLAHLEDAKRRVGEIEPAQLERLLAQIGRQRFSDAPSLARFHDALLFLRAHPPNRTVLKRTEKLLATFAVRVDQLRKSGADLSSLDEEETAGIAGTVLTAPFHYDQVRWLVKKFPGDVSIDWVDYDKSEQLAATLPRFIPLLEDDSLVEPDVPYQRWMQAAAGGPGRELGWLVRQCEKLPLAAEEKAEIFGSLELPIRWQLPSNSSASRTHARLPMRRIFYQREPLIRRSEVSLAKELAKPPLRLKKLSRRRGEEILDLCQRATDVRYRELYGTTRGDPESVVQADVGRGVQVFLWALPPERRLPLRAYQAGFTLKNGVPINYIEGISLFEWMEIGFNTFYAYRDGETAWIYAQVLRLLHQILGAECISVYPYQIGQDNEEAIQSGAFWFYRKLGFRPMRAELARLAAAEEKKIAANPKYRTPERMLRKLALGHVVYELPEASPGAWDGFRMRNVGLAVQERMAKHFGADAAKIREASAKQLAGLLKVSPSNWSALEQRALANFSLVADLIPDLKLWNSKERNLLSSIIRAKAKASEPEYARLLREHRRLRFAILKLGAAGKVTAKSTF